MKTSELKQMTKAALRGRTGRLTASVKVQNATLRLGAGQAVTVVGKHGEHLNVERPHCAYCGTAVLLGRIQAKDIALDPAP